MFVFSREVDAYRIDPALVKSRGMDRAKGSLERDPVIDAFRKDVDRTLLERNLGLSVEERFLQLMELQRFAAGLRDAGRKAREA